MQHISPSSVVEDRLLHSVEIPAVKEIATLVANLESQQQLHSLTATKPVKIPGFLRWLTFQNGS